MYVKPSHTFNPTAFPGAWARRSAVLLSFLREETVLMSGNSDHAVIMSRAPYWVLYLTTLRRKNYYFILKIKKRRHREVR